MFDSVIRDPQSPHGTLGSGSDASMDDVCFTYAAQSAVTAARSCSTKGICGIPNDAKTEIINRRGSENESETASETMDSGDADDHTHNTAICTKSSQETVTGLSRDLVDKHEEHTETKTERDCSEIVTRVNHVGDERYHISIEQNHQEFGKNENSGKTSGPGDFFNQYKNAKIPHSPIQHNVVSSTRTDCDLRLTSPPPTDYSNQIVSDAVESFMTSPTTEYPPDAVHNLRKRRARITLPSRSRQRRETLQDMARPLKRWLYSHKHNPYPTKDDKVRLAHVSTMTLTQVSNWFANARRRLKNTVRTPGMTWEDRIRCYNDHVVGKAELLSVSSMGSDCESDLEGELTEYPAGPIGLPNGKTDNLSVCDEAKKNIMQRFLSESYQTLIKAGDAKSDMQQDTLPPIQHVAGMHNDGDKGTDKGPRSGSHIDSNQPPRSINGEDDTMYWKEVSAAMALTCLANSIQ